MSNSGRPVEDFIIGLADEVLNLKIEIGGKATDSGSVIWDEIQGFLLNRLYDEFGNGEDLDDDLVDEATHWASLYEIYYSWNGRLTRVIYELGKLPDKTR